MDGHMHARMDKRTEIIPSVLQDILPFGSAAQKGYSLGPSIRRSVTLER